jgi:hypothetical protein
MARMSLKPVEFQRVILALTKIFTRILFACTDISLMQNFTFQSWRNKSILKLSNACYHSVQNHLSSRILPKNANIKIHKTIILPVVLYGCETWSRTVRGERRLRVFEKIVLKKIFGPTRGAITGEWRRLHTKELYALYSSTNIIRVIK